MGQESEANFGHRTVDDWVKGAWTGQLAVADFQRSFVWPPKKAARYIEAILRGRPVGMYLILDSAPSPQFSPRKFSYMDTPLNKVTELVLDGQQRLSSLLHALYEHPISRFFIAVEDFSAASLSVKTVIAYGKQSASARKLREPVAAYQANVIPIDVLRRPGPDADSELRLTQWCSDVMGKVDSFETYHQMTLFQNKVIQFAEALFFQRPLYFFRLPKTTSRAEATDIFVETNTSSVKIKTFDEQVARVRGDENQDFRKMISEARDNSEVLRHFFPIDKEKAIPMIGTWLLKLGCLHAGVPPKRNHYEHGAQHLFNGDGSDDGSVPKNFQKVLDDVEWVLKRVSDMGSPTRSVLPSWPPVHVLAAIRSRYQGIQDPEESDFARRLIDAYYWRSLFTNRHERQANDRLHRDFEELLEVLGGGGDIAGTMRVFSDQHHPLYSAEWLQESAGWIGRSRTGKALIALVLAAEPSPVDWITGEPLRATHVRQLEAGNNLDRHHVFPKKVLSTAGVPQREIDNGLNGVLLDKRTNRRFWKHPPDQYIIMVTKNKRIDEAVLLERIVGHLVPHEDMVNTVQAIRDRYRSFREKRAQLLLTRIRELAQPPAGALSSE